MTLLNRIIVATEGGRAVRKVAIVGIERPSGRREMLTNLSRSGLKLQEGFRRCKDTEGRDRQRRLLHLLRGDDTTADTFDTDAGLLDSMKSSLRVEAGAAVRLSLSAARTGRIRHERP